MIYTVTFNPAIDYVVTSEKFQIGEVNRAEKEALFFGGKGINVSLVLKELGIKSKALGFVAGFTGEALEQGIEEAGIETDFVHLKQGFTRINVKLKSGQETELNGQGPEIGPGDIEKFFYKLDELKPGDTLVLAGSIPSSLPKDMYQQILEYVKEKDIRAVVDASGDLLKNVLSYHPFLIKPNHFELGELFGVKTESKEEVIHYAQRLQNMGAVNVLISMAKDGAILLDEYGKVHECGICEGKAVNSVGAGDSMVAGFLASMEQGDYEYALKLGSGAGNATALSEGLATREKIEEMLGKL